MGVGLGSILDAIGTRMRTCFINLNLCEVVVCVGLSRYLSGDGLLNDLLFNLAIKVQRKLKHASRAASIGGCSFTFEYSRHVLLLLFTLLLDICGFRQFAGDLSRMAGEGYRGAWLCACGM